MATYVISDIHGEFIKFKQALKVIKFSPSDTLYILGDMIDRGFDSKAVLDIIFRLKQEGYQIHCSRGNHEQMLLDSLDDFSVYMNWLKNGGAETLSSFFTTDINKVPIEYIEFFKSLPYFFEVNQYILVHAGINMTAPFPLEDYKSMLWMRDSINVYSESWIGNRTIIHGHTPTDNSQILDQINRKDKIICIDNGAYIKRKNFGEICILRLDDMFVQFQN